MITELKMPQLGVTMDTGVIVEWSKTEGDRIELDEPVLVVETDKAAVDVPAPVTGILGRIVAPVSEADIPIGQTIAYIVESKSELADLPSDARSLAGELPLKTRGDDLQSPVAAPNGHADVAEAAAVAPRNGRRLPTSRERVFASPRARAKAASLGLDLATTPFAGNRIVEADVLSAANALNVAASAEEVRLTPLAAKLAVELGIQRSEIESPSGARVRAADLLAYQAAVEGAAPQLTPAIALHTDVSSDSETRELNRYRRVTAERMTISSQTAPQSTLVSRVDMTEALILEEKLQEEAMSRGVRLTDDALIVRAVATALLEHPEANAQWADDGQIRVSSVAHVGVAVDIAGEGLIVPVVRNAHARGLLDIAAELDRLLGGVARMALGAGSGALDPSDYSGSTFTITNLSHLGIEFFTPIVNLPEAAILGVGSILPTPVFLAGELTQRQLMALSLTIDHRVVDGAPAARFLARVREILERPLLLLAHGL